MVKVKKRAWTGILFLLTAVLWLVCTGCQKEPPDSSQSSSQTVSEEMIYRQKQIHKPTELTLSEDGTVTIEVETAAKPDQTPPEEKAPFLAVSLKEKGDISVQYTYDTYGKEGSIFCCERKVSDEGQTKLMPVFSRYLAQTSEESYGEVWLSTGILLEKGEHLFYVNGGEQTLPYRMTLEITFLNPDSIGKILLYPGEEP